MSVISSLKQQTTNLTRKALKLGTDFVHPGSGSSGDQPITLEASASRTKAASRSPTPTNGATTVRPSPTSIPKQVC